MNDGLFIFEFIASKLGSDPNTQFLQNTDSLKLNRSFIEVDSKFQTSAPNIYAGGDVVLHSNELFGGALINIAHWATAQSHGEC